MWEDLWCLGGDFNVTRFSHERSREGRLTQSMRGFSNFIDEVELVDLPLLRGCFTWSGRLHNQNLARLDHFLLSQEWIDRFGSVLQTKLPKSTSDHHPILLEGGGVRRGPIPSILIICGQELRVFRIS